MGDDGDCAHLVRRGRSAGGLRLAGQRWRRGRDPGAGARRGAVDRSQRGGADLSGLGAARPPAGARPRRDGAAHHHARRDLADADRDGAAGRGRRRHLLVRGRTVRRAGGACAGGGDRHRRHRGRSAVGHRSARLDLRAARRAGSGEGRVARPFRLRAKALRPDSPEPWRRRSGWPGAQREPTTSTAPLVGFLSV